MKHFFTRSVLRSSQALRGALRASVQPTRWLRRSSLLAAAWLLGTGLATAQTSNRPAPATLAEDGTPAFIQLPAGAARPAASEGPQVLRQQLALSADEQLRPLRTETDDLGFVHERFQEYFRGVKVEHGVYSLHARNGRIETLNGEIKHPAATLSTQPSLTQAAALQRALAAVGARRYKWELPGEEAFLRAQTGDRNATYRPKGELVVVGDFRQPAASRPLVLAWKFNVYAQEPVSRDLLYVDAHTGQVVLRDAVIKHLNSPATFATRYLGARTSTTDQSAGGYRLRETVTGKGVITLNCRKSTTLSTAVDFVDNDNNWTAAEYDNANFDNAALDAHLGAQATQGYWVNEHGRDSFDDKGAILRSFVHYGSAIDNAYWDGSEMLYGDGNTSFKPLTAIDVCGHEIGHAVCSSTANLTYSNESGALNEGLSDIWGACVENYLDPNKQIWLIGEDITRTRVALRSMSNPNSQNQPDTYLGTRWYAGTADNGGVHTNSGVLNFWFYLLSVGGSGTNDLSTTYAVNGINIQRAARITYRAERLYMTASTNYAGARTATLQAAVDLYGFGSAEVRAVANAWRAVGLDLPAPTITTLAPASGTIGSTVVITGTNLGTAFSVTFNGTAVTTGIITSTTQLTVTVPAGATTGSVVVTTPSGAATSPGVFTVTGTGAAPAISSFTPAAGQVAGGSVIITGTNFSGATNLTFNGTAATFVVNSATQITATVPATATSGLLQVTTPGGSATSPTAFTVLPFISGFTPTGGGPVGSTVTINGTSFTGALSVKFNGQYAASYTVVSATQLTAVVPNTATTGPLTVRTPSGTATSATNFTVTASLAVSSFLPISGEVNTRVTIQGAGFTGTTAVTFNGVAASSFTVASDTELWVTVPATATTGRIVVTSPLGTAQSTTNFTVVVVPANDLCTATNIPVLTCGSTLTGTTIGSTSTGDPTASCSGLTIGGSGVFYTIIGTGGSITLSTCNATTNFDSELFVYSGGCGTYTCVASNDDDVTCSTRASASTVTFTSVAGTSYIIFVTGYGGAMGAFGLSATCATVAPFITSLNPTSGPVGTAVTISGSSFTGATGVTLNGSTVAFTLVNATTITFTVPAGATTGNVVVTTPLGASSGVLFTVTAPPAITTFTPPNGPVGTAVTLTGTNFTGATAVTFNGTTATFTVVSATSITTSVPTGATTGVIRVTTPNGTATSSTSFTVTIPVTPLSLSTSSTNVSCNGAATGAATVAVTGGTAPYSYSWNTTPVQTTATATGLPAGTYTVTVTDAGGQSAMASATITQPSAVALTTTATAPTCLGGNNGTASASATGGTGAYSYSWNTTPAQTTAVATGLAAGTYTVTVTDANGCPATRTATVGAGAATAFGNFAPGNGLVGSSVILSGTSLGCVTGVAFNGTTASFTLNGNGTITATVPAGASTGLITLNTAGGAVASTTSFVVTAPDLTISTTASVPAGTYNNVTITGTGNATLSGNLTVNGALVVATGGTLADGCFSISGSGSFTLSAGATLAICDVNGLRATGNSGSVRMTGTRSFSTEASYVYNGTAAQETGSGLPPTVRSLATTNNSPVTLSLPVAITQTLTVAGTGNLVLNGQGLTLLSNAAGTALVVNSGTGLVQGAATVQRYISPNLNPGLGYRHYSSPVASTTVADLVTPIFTPVVNSTYNTAAQPNLVTPFPTVFGYDQSRLASTSNNLTMFSKGWFSPSALTNLLLVGRGYTANIPATETVDFVGTLNSGSYTLNLARNAGATAADAGWQLLGNPYPAPIDWALVDPTDRTGVDGSIYLFESNSQYGGTYRAFVNQIGPNSLIASGQAFFTRVSSGQTAGTVVFRNSQRLTSFASQVPFRRGTADLRPQVELALQGSTSLTDKLFVYAEAGATAGPDVQFDAVKLANPTGLNLSTLASSGERLAIDGRPAFTAAMVVPLSLGVPAAGTYTLQAANLANIPAGLDAYLLDNLTGQSINLRQQPSYSFSLTAAQAATALVGRFSLSFGPTAGPLATATALQALVQLYPNPAHKAVSIELPTTLRQQPVGLALVNALGQQVLTRTLPAATSAYSLPLTDVAAGVYSVQLTTAQGIINKRLVIE